MSEYKKADLITKINSDFADNDQGAITAQSLRTNFAHVLDSIVPIMASGTDVYFKSNVDIRDNSVSSASSVIGGINAQWNDNDVASIKFLTGSDTTNKDDGGIAFYTSASGVSSSTGGAGVVKKMEIANTGKVSIYGSGVSDATLQVRSIHGSGLGLLFSGSERNIAAQNGKNLSIGHWNSSSQEFSDRISISSVGDVGIGFKTPKSLLHVRSSGDAVWFDQQSNITQDSSLYFNKWDAGSTGYTGDDFWLGYGMGVHVPKSGYGRFFIGVDSDRDRIVNVSDAALVIGSGKFVGIGNILPKERLVVGDDLGYVSSRAGNSLVIGDSDGPSHLFIGSGVGNEVTSNYARAKWEHDQHRLVFSTKRNYIHNRDQLVLDSTNGNVGIGRSGITSSTWNPNYNLHVSSSGAASTFAVENAGNTSSAMYLGVNTGGGGSIGTGNWGVVGFDTGSNSLRINNTGTISDNQLAIDSDGHVAINYASAYNSTSIGTNRLHVYGENVGVIVGDVFSGSNSALRLLGSRTTNDSAYIQAGTSAADTSAELKISRFDTDASNLASMDVYSDVTTFHGSGIFTGINAGGDFSLDGSYLINNKTLTETGTPSGIYIDTAGKVGVGTNSPTSRLDIASGSLRIRTDAAVPTASSAGNVGDIRWGTTGGAYHLYICIATNTWVRSELATF